MKSLLLIPMTLAAFCFSSCAAKMDASSCEKCMKCEKCSKGDMKGSCCGKPGCSHKKKAM
ncbi:MAG: hypothetical protein HC845_04955 [Akkermansiaceae bacterium]|nr:hypothetical protein [Akkermansiaceae bacterium]